MKMYLVPCISYDITFDRWNTETSDDFPKLPTVFVWVATDSKEFRDNAAIVHENINLIKLRKVVFLFNSSVLPFATGQYRQYCWMPGSRKTRDKVIFAGQT